MENLFSEKNFASIPGVVVSLELLLPSSLTHSAGSLSCLPHDVISLLQVTIAEQLQFEFSLQYASE